MYSDRTVGPSSPEREAHSNGATLIARTIPLLGKWSLVCNNDSAKIATNFAVYTYWMWPCAVVPGIVQKKQDPFLSAAFY